MRYVRIASRLYNRPLLVRPAFALAVSGFIRSRMDGSAGEDKAPAQVEYREPYQCSLDANGIFTVPVVGGLYRRGDAFDADCGAQSYTNLSNTLAAARDNKDVKGILLDIDSPGGEAIGCFSFCETIRNINSVKPVWGIASGHACSAAYAIGASCGKLFAASDAEVGSIGVVWLHLDYSKHLEQNGIVATYVYAGDRKVDGNPFEPLPPEVRAEIQSEIDKRYEQFVSLVAAYRPITADAVRATQARTYLGNEAKDLGLIDDVAGFEDVRQELARATSPREVKIFTFTERRKAST